MKKIIYILVIISFNCCHLTFSTDVDIDLGNNYKLFSTKGKNRDSKIILSKEKGYRNIISSQVIDCTYDSIFILAAQRPWDSITTTNLKERYEMYLNSNFYQLWIINKINDSIYGPFQKDNYLKIKKELGISNSLQLKMEKEDNYEYVVPPPTSDIIDLINDKIKGDK